MTESRRYLFRDAIEAATTLRRLGHDVTFNGARFVMEDGYTFISLSEALEAFKRYGYRVSAQISGASYFVVEK